MRTWGLFLALVVLGGCGAREETAALALQGAPGCNAAAQRCEARGTAGTLTFSVADIRAMQPAAVEATWRGPAVESVVVSFSMVGMDMGENRYRLLPDDKGVWSGKAVLPVCIRGRSDWVADVVLREPGGAVHTARFDFTAVP